MIKILLFLLIGSNVFAQSIINTESITAKTDKYIFSEIEGAFDLQQGNTQIFQLETSVLIGLNLYDNNLIKLIAGPLI